MTTDVTKTNSIAPAPVQITPITIKNLSRNGSSDSTVTPNWQEFRCQTPQGTWVTLSWAQTNDFPDVNFF